MISEAADVSLAHTARVLRHFDEQRYTAKTGAERGRSAAREFCDPGRMLSDWAGHYGASGGPGQAIEFHVPWRESEQSVSVLNEALGRQSWALTAEAAADHIAPYLTSVPRLDFYVAAEDLFSTTRALLQHPEITPVETGGRIRMYAADPYVLRLSQDVDDVRTASAIRVYADLLCRQGRSAQAGEHLREVAVGF